ncbi:uncharacterized protein LOC126561753 [Anopheles maculipalpis]|uniref:uncharacterized protein LOC126561753 n=1 Tax=Anopheles maculipalpis TaxID=1496333 RepID=UPI0021591989|nr:uncharacterized protein LOC126561753 [Anopheles maculipalpis]
MIDQQPKLSYFPIESKCSAGQSEPDPGGSLTNENADSANNANINANVANAGNTVTPAGPGMNGSNSSCSAKTPITTNGGPTQPSVPRTTHQHPGYSSTGTTPTLAEGQRLLLAAVMTAGSGGGDGGGDSGIHGVGTGGESEHLAGLLGTSLCGQCCGPICDRYIMKVVDITYHERCLQCTSCSIRLMHSCFMREGKLYCRFDYERLYGRNRCLGCGEKIGADELVMRALDNVFHLKCFICVVCGVRLQKGDQYVIKQSQLFCRPDYEKEVEMFQGYSYDEYCCDDMFQTRIDGRRGPKRPRTILTTQQRRAFKASFDISPKPCRKIREGLAKDTGLSIRIVQVWFQNQRAKMKKIQKKQLKEGGKSSHHGGVGGNATGNKNHNGNNGKGNDSQEELSDNESAGVGGKLSLRIKDENSRSNNYLHDSCSDNEGTVTDNDGGPLYGGSAARLGLGGSDPYKIVKEELDLEDDYFRMAMSTPNQHLHHHHHHHHHPQQHPQHPHTPGGGRFGGKSFANEHQSGIKTENMTLDTTTMLSSNGTTLDYGVSLQQLASSMNGAPLPNVGNGGPAAHESIGPMVNPIDRLYSMQNSYFCNQDNPISCPTTPTGHPGTPPGGNHHRPNPGSGPQQPNQMHLQHSGLQQSSMPSHHFSGPPNSAQSVNMVNLGGANVGMGQHMVGMCNPMLEQQQQQQQQQQQESVM